ncbi:hypothetical protein [Rhizomonospora bruguierae]|uniref:hypothetical protein n=1 Tax=Rhizomonospora bruguierae TaxID=1581705 RepID=UPI001BCD25A7|nr:hypothetical protein [Micromonospora sp. NBRC 107566]
MTDWKNHHPPHDHPDFDAYLDSLTEDDIAALNGAILYTNEPADSARYRQHPGAETAPDNDLTHQ